MKCRADALRMHRDSEVEESELEEDYRALY